MFDLLREWTATVHILPLVESPRQGWVLWYAYTSQDTQVRHPRLFANATSSHPTRAWLFDEMKLNNGEDALVGGCSLTDRNSGQAFHDELLRIGERAGVRWALLLAPVDKGGLLFTKVGIALLYPERMKLLNVRH